MVNKIYEGVKGSGNNLWEAIMNSGYGNYDPPLIEEWIRKQSESYLSEDEDHRYIKKYVELLPHSRLDIWFDILREKDMDLDDYEINRNDLKKWSEEYIGIKKEICLYIYETILKEIDDSSSKRNINIYDLAGEDFNWFSQELDKDDDDQVRDFFGQEFKLIGYEAHGIKYGLDEIYICPSCDEIIVKEDMKANYERDIEDKYDSRICYCDNCGSEAYFNEDWFIKANPYIPKDELIARCV